MTTVVRAMPVAQYKKAQKEERERERQIQEEKEERQQLEEDLKEGRRIRRLLQLINEYEPE